MASVDEGSLGIARLYARAMLAVADGQGAAESLGEELAALVGLVQTDDEVGSFLSSPILDRDKRGVSLEKMLRGRASDLLVDSLQVINKKDRLALLEQMLEVYQHEIRGMRGQVEVKVTTAVPLTDEQREHLMERTSRYTGKESFLVEVVDADLLGGLVIQIGDQKVDMSVRRDLQLLGKAYARRLSGEVLGGEKFVIETDSRESADGREEE